MIELHYEWQDIFTLQPWRDHTYCKQIKGRIGMNDIINNSRFSLFILHVVIAKSNRIKILSKYFIKVSVAWQFVKPDLLLVNGLILFYLIKIYYAALNLVSSCENVCNHHCIFLISHMIVPLRHFKVNHKRLLP